MTLEMLLPQKICDMEIDDSNLYSNCKKRDKKCEDYKTQTDCDADTVLKKNDKKCSWDYSLGKCREYGIDDCCTVTNGNCEEVNAPPGGQVCLFDTHLKLNCKAREKTCTNYLDRCESTFPLKDNENTQCLQIDPIKMCKSVTIDENCKVQSTTYLDGTTYFSCVNRKDFPQNEGICAFDDEQEKNKCTLTQENVLNTLIILVNLYQIVFIIIMLVMKLILLVLLITLENAFLDPL